jgi:hypothetical protein
MSGINGLERLKKLVADLKTEARGTYNSMEGEFLCQSLELFIASATARSEGPGWWKGHHEARLYSVFWTR